MSSPTTTSTTSYGSVTSHDDVEEQPKQLDATNNTNAHNAEPASNNEDQHTLSPLSAALTLTDGYDDYDHDCCYSWRQTNIPILVTALLASLAAGGPTYAFGLYGSTLKATLHLTQSQLDTISSANFCAGMISCVPGLLVDRWGPRTAMMVGGVLQCGALWAYWFAARHFAAAVEVEMEENVAVAGDVGVSTNFIVATLSALGVLIFMSNSLVIGSLFKALVMSCGKGSKGSAVGAAKGYLGLGAGAYSALFDAIRTSQNSDLDFLPMAACLAILVTTLPAWLLLPPRQQDLAHVAQVVTPRHYRLVYSGLFALAFVVVGTSALFMFEPLPEDFQEQQDLLDTVHTTNDSTVGGRHYTKAASILLLWMAPILALFFLPQPDEPPMVDEMSLIMERQQSQSIRTSRSLRHQESGWSLASAATSTNQEESIRLLEVQESFHRLDSCGDGDVEASSLRFSSQPPPFYNGRALSSSFHRSSTRMSTTTSCRSTTTTTDGSGRNYTLTQVFHTIPAWLLLWTCVMLVGSGTMLTNNMGQMVESLQFPNRAASACLTLFSVAQAAARVATGAATDQAAHRAVPRTAFYVVAAALGVLAHAVLAVGSTTRRGFVVGVMLAGTAFGMVWPLMVLVIGEIFGTVNHGANYMFYDGFTSAFGTLLISKYITQTVYERQAVVHETAQAVIASGDDSSSNSNSCLGEDCFQMSHVITAVLCLTCVLTSASLWYNTRDVYDEYDQQRDSSSGSGRASGSPQKQVDELYGSPYLQQQKNKRKKKTKKKQRQSSSQERQSRLGAAGGGRSRSVPRRTQS